MLKTKPDKRIISLCSDFEPILVCNDKKLRPFLEVITESPENIAQHHLGTLIGVFEISDTSEDSSYIVNYLISVIKKEYFSKPKRGPIESFEAALRKGNLALSKLAEHENINWIGKLNAVCAIIEKNHLHLAQTGTASAYLLRKKILTDISDAAPVDDPAPNPLKTFDNISSGKIELADKLLITTENIFDIFSLEEIKKSALRFSAAEFVQFLKTALGNELEKSAALVIDVREKQEKKLVPAAEPVPAEKMNFFSQSTYKKKEKITAEVKTEIQEELTKEKEDSGNKTTGHIYIKESEDLEVRKTSATDWLMSFKDKLAEAESKLTPPPVSAKKEALAKFSDQIASFKKKISATKIPRPRNPLPKEKIIWFLATLLEFTKKAVALLGLGLKFIGQKIVAALLYLAKGGQVFIKYVVEKIRAIREERASQRTAAEPTIEVMAPTATPTAERLRFLPDFSKIKKLATRLTYEQKLYAGVIIVAILVVPYFIAQYTRDIAAKKAVSLVQEVPVVIVPLAQDKNVTRVENLTSLYSGSAVKPINLNGKMFAVAQNEIVDLAGNTTFAVPTDFGHIDLVAGMDDLNVLFLINKQDKKVLTWSQNNKKFQPNNINIPAGTNVVAAETYLTYLYLVDSTNNQIYRFPRADGGFGDKADWLKPSTDIPQVTGMAISENLLTANNQEILKFFRGKKQDFALETSATLIAPFKVYSKIDSQNIFVLDQQNARVIKLDLAGNIVAQYYNAEISQATDFAIDEANLMVYISTLSNIKSFKL